MPLPERVQRHCILVYGGTSTGGVLLNPTAFEAQQP